MAATYTVEALQDILRASATFHTRSLDLSKRELEKMPQDFPVLQNLQGLYLEGNHLVLFPEDLVLKLRNLRWLDLRNNQLSALPSNISCLRELRTLLLEGNQLTSLPCQLGALRHLNGLNIANNPLQYPPAHITQQGTKAVLKYLSNGLNEVTVEDETLDDCSQHSWQSPERSSNSQREAVQSGAPGHSHLPVPSSQKALLHLQADAPHRLVASKQLQQEDNMQRKHVHSRKPARSYKTDRALWNNKLTALSQAENEQISGIIDRQRSNRQLEEWREDVRRQQKEQHKLSNNTAALKPKTTEFAPYGNDLQEPLHTAKTTDVAKNRRDAVAKRLHKHYKKVNNSSSTMEDHIQESEDDDVPVHHTSVQPTIEGVRLEPGWEAKRAREYRLSAFTGDILVQASNS